MFKIYKNSVIFLVVLSFFSYIFTYLGIAVNPALSPLYFIYLSIPLIVLLVVSDIKSIAYILSAPIFRWMLFYLIIYLIWIMLPNAQASYTKIRQVTLSIVFIFTVSTLLFFDDDKLSITKKAILLATLIAIFNNIYEFFNPTAFFPLDFIKKINGRSGGFYTNATVAGEAIIIGLILSYNIVPNKFKTIFLLATLLGIIPTFSRAGIAFWFIVVFLLSWAEIIARKKLLIVSAVILASIIIMLPILIFYINANIDNGGSNIINRLNFFTSKDYVVDTSQEERLSIAIAAFNHFSDNPLFGEGIGFFGSGNWGYRVFPHNIYLLLMVEHGIIGLFILPLLLLSTIWKSTGEARKISLVFSTYILLIGFTNHNILFSWNILVAFSTIAAMSFKSRNL